MYNNLSYRLNLFKFQYGIESRSLHYSLISNAGDGLSYFVRSLALPQNRTSSFRAYVGTLRRKKTTRPKCLCNFLKPTGHVMHHQFNIQQLYALPTLYLCVLYLSENKQRLVPLTA